MIAALATGCGIGRLPKAPGTWASLAAIVIAIPVMALSRWQGMAALALVTTLAGIWASDLYASQTRNPDPKECVIDEFAGQWIACAIGGLSAMPYEPALSWIGFTLAFFLFRLFDIAKPWLVKRAENLPGGLGIMADDVVAGVMAGFVVFLFGTSGFL